MTKYAIFEKVEVSMDIPQYTHVQGNNLYGGSKELNIVSHTDFEVSSNPKYIIDKYLNRYHQPKNKYLVLQNEKDLIAFFDGDEDDEIEITESFDEELLTIKIVRL